MNKRYSQEALDAALKEVKKGMPKKTAAKKYGIPRQTIQSRLINRCKKITPGPSPYLSDEEEKTLVKWIIECCAKGFPQRKKDVQLSVQNFLKVNNRPNPFKENLPGKGWYKAFVRRHPEISSYNETGVSSANAFISERDIRGWFSKIEGLLCEEGNIDLLNHPDRIFNADETNFLLCDKNIEVLAPKSQKNIFEMEKMAITVLFNFSAAGEACPPMIVYPYKKVPTKTAMSVPEAWGIGRSDSGWMKPEIFHEYISSVFVPYLKETKVNLPVILFVDRQRSHISLQISELCRTHKIILIALYPNVVRMLRPCDVSSFRPLKENWKQYFKTWMLSHPNEIVTKENFATILKPVFENSIEKCTIVNGFRACGLYPWDPNAIDYSKCLSKC